MRAAFAAELGGIDSVHVGELPAPFPATGQALVRVRGAGAGQWDTGFLGAGIVDTAGQDTGVKPGDHVYGTLFPAGGGFAELAVVDTDRLAPMPGKADFLGAAGLVIAAGTAHEGLTDRGRLKPGQTVLVTAAAGGVGSAAVQIAAALGARVLGVASSASHERERGLRLPRRRLGTAGAHRRARRRRPAHGLRRRADPRPGYRRAREAPQDALGVHRARLIVHRSQLPGTDDTTPLLAVSRTGTTIDDTLVLTPDTLIEAWNLILEAMAMAWAESW
jgi:hypothetical protein